MTDQSKFALIGNPADIDHLYEAVRFYKPTLSLSKKAVQKIIEWTPPFKGVEITKFRSRTGKIVNGFNVNCTFIPEMVNLSPRLVHEKILQSCQLAKNQGAVIAALGAFTSIGIANRQEELSNRLGINLTTGNTFTAYLTVEGVLRAARLMQLPLPSSHVAVIGASGDIGSGCCKALSNKVSKLTLTAVGIKKLERFAEKLRPDSSATITTTTDNKRAVKDADIIITTAASVDSILALDDFKPGALICDVGFPKNVSVHASQRKDIFAFAGGVAQMPDEIDFGYDQTLPSKKFIYGCYAEAIILFLKERIENFSSGRGNITEEKMKCIGRWGEKHGFTLAPFFCGTTVYTSSELTRIQETVIQARQRTNEIASC